MDGSGKFALLCGATTMLFATGGAIAASSSSNDNHAVASRVLAVHNSERDQLRLPRLKWNRNLEREAANWARNLSRRGVLQHADNATRNGTGENLWMGTAGHWPVENMVGMFIEEKKHYRHASFPNISRTGNWADVGHYTQIVWRDTQEVGCAVVSARGNDVLVCRYWPAGNVWGQRAY
ncbi:CAP domain-containing protein [Qipengyuania marisflavi]|uniref:SCP-like extracellular n=1 Tax=Qipengyuania marisflavi TaxID=2486356 RepID=A0A5S3P8R0_9SPHN|nr:CAP domain-containing protein [Qipengyuania marisflavi]TMM49892.1 SCP-like extracellular [Qipengyuania marisflavi]